MSDTFATSFGVLNYSGMLFNKGNTRTPLSTLIGSRRKVTNHVKFTMGQDYTGGGTGSIPNISETDSLTAPDSSVATRTPHYNVTQIFHEAIGISYGKMSNMGTLSGLNVEGQKANPQDELDFQVAIKMQKIARDIEYCFINGVYQEATSDATVNKMGGLVSGITTNTKAMAGKPLTYWAVVDMLKTMHDNNAPVNELVLWCDGVSLLQLNADATANGMTVVPASREVNGIKLSTLATPYGDVMIYLGECMPSGTTLVLNINAMSIVEQPTPKHGNFFLEQLSKTGAGEKYQIFGQCSIDYGMEWLHGKFTGIKATFSADDFVKKVKTVE